MLAGTRDLDRTASLLAADHHSGQQSCQLVRLTFVRRYSLALVADQSTEPERWTSTRLRREVLYLESRHRRFELAHCGSSHGFDQYSLSEVLRPHTLDRKMMEASGVPLPDKMVRRLHEKLDWEELVWGPCFVRVRGEEYPLVRALYMPQSVAS